MSLLIPQMLELEVIPERAIAAGQWQFVLGIKKRFKVCLIVLSSISNRNAPSTGGGHIEEAVYNHQECTAKIQ